MLAYAFMYVEFMALILNLLMIIWYTAYCE